MKSLNLISSTADCAIYQMNQADSDSNVISYIASTPETRAILNNPLITGIKYTKSLRQACTKILKQLPKLLPIQIVSTLTEENTSVLNILRGGLNFGLREALGDAYGWNNHAAAFISAQRVRDARNSEEWHITESSYQKVFLPDNSVIVFGDVVATGTSLEFALNELLQISESTNHQISSLIFFTIGGPRSSEILDSISKKAKKIFPNFAGSVVIYLEGCFSVASDQTPLSIKYTGTDLLRRDSILAPEFIKSQLESPSFPIERCTIYDAGSRAFWLKEYFEDILEYWEATLTLAEKGITYRELVTERFPEINEFLENDSNFDFANVDLIEVCKSQITKIKTKQAPTQNT